MKFTSLFFAIAITSTSAHAFEFQPTSLEHLSLDVAKFTCNRDPMTPDIPCKDYRGRVRLNFNLGLLNDLIKWENHLHGEGTDAKFETLGWNYIVSIPTPWNITPFYDHHSRHRLDSGQPTAYGKEKPERFPVEDSYGLKFTFYDRVKK